MWKVFGVPLLLILCIIPVEEQLYSAPQYPVCIQMRMLIIEFKINLALTVDTSAAYLHVACNVFQTCISILDQKSDMLDYVHQWS